jgi:hypothetical protein
MLQQDNVYRLPHRLQGVGCRSDNIRRVLQIDELPLLGAQEQGNAPSSAPDFGYAANDDLPPGAAIASEYGPRIVRSFGIAIAVFCIVYFGGQLLRAVLS